MDKVIVIFLIVAGTYAVKLIVKSLKEIRVGLKELKDLKK